MPEFDEAASSSPIVPLFSSLQNVCHNVHRPSPVDGLTTCTRCFYTPSAQARHIGDNKGIRRERAIDIDVDPADSTDVDVITSAAAALSLGDTVENRTEDLAEAIGRITL